MNTDTMDTDTMETGKIDNPESEENTQSGVVDGIREKLENVNWKAKASKVMTFSTSSIFMFEWNGIDFKLHGFLVLMVIFDVAWNTIFAGLFEGIPWFFYSIFRNASLFVVVLLACYLRIIFFTSSTQQNDQSAADETNEKLDEIKELDDIDNDEIQVKNVLISYLGGFIKLKKMSKEKMTQVFYFVFPVIFHGLAAILCLVFGVMSSGPNSLSFYNENIKDTICWKNLWFWLRNANLYCLLMCLLPCPGFDGAALLTLYLKTKYEFSKIGITLTLILISAIITVVCGIMGFMSVDLIAIYICVFCGARLIEYAFNPNDENMKVLRAMAKTTKQMHQADLV